MLVRRLVQRLVLMALFVASPLFSTAHAQPAPAACSLQQIQAGTAVQNGQGESEQTISFTAPCDGTFEITAAHRVEPDYTQDRLQRQAHLSLSVNDMLICEITDRHRLAHQERDCDNQFVLAQNEQITVKAVRSQHSATETAWNFHATFVPQQTAVSESPPPVPPPAPTPVPTPTPTPAPIPIPSLIGFNVACALPFADASPRTYFDNSCRNQGQPTAHVGFTLDQVTAMYTLKNNYCAPGPAVNVDFADMGRFQQGTMQLTDGSAMAEGQRVRLVGYVAAVKTTHSNEGVNCHYTDDATTDIHINVSQISNDECQGIVAELIPHLRPTALTHDNVKQALSGKVIRVTGQLFNDAEHHAACHQSGQPSRLSVWEVHPIYLLDICTSTTITNCPIDDDSVWTPYLAAP